MRLGPGDEARAAAVLLHPAVRYRLFDDSEIPTVLAIGEILRDEDLYILMPIDGAILTVAPFVYSTFTIHQAAVPEVRGAVFIQAAHEAVRWIFGNIPACHKLVGLVPSYNVPSIASATRCGFKVEGRLTGAVMRDGKLHDLIVLGLARGEGTQ